MIDSVAIWLAGERKLHSIALGISPGKGKFQFVITASISSLIFYLALKFQLGNKAVDFLAAEACEGMYHGEWMMVPAFAMLAILQKDSLEQQLCCVYSKGLVNIIHFFLLSSAYFVF